MAAGGHVELDLDRIAEWMAQQRWFTGKPRRPRLRLVTTIELPVLEPFAPTIVALLADQDDAADRLYQVPLVRRSAPPTDRSHVVTESEGVCFVDAVHDAAFAPSALAACGVDAGSIVDSALLRGEQSNSSVVVRMARGDQLVVKVFRVLQGGANPDVVLQRALLGAPMLPRFEGVAEAEWIGLDGDAVKGQLMFAQEFAEGAVDAWRLAIESAEFADSARELGAATRSMHALLAERLGEEPPDAETAAGLAAQWRRRLDLALAAAPQLEELAAAIRARYDEALASGASPRQRVHGDLHLGQVLRTVDGRWLFIDFEGEPLRPLAVRNEPDSPLRDVAGMLRSLDYARAGSGADAAWGERTRDAFLDGYFPGGVPAGLAPLLEAFELDKAVYEVRYEAGNRPDWIGIPLDAVRRLLGGAGTG